MTDKKRGQSVPTGNKADPTPIAATKPVEEPVVEQVPDESLTIKNPNVSIRIVVHGLPTHKIEGLRASSMKNARSWIRQRNLTIRWEGVTKTDEEGKGKEGADLITITFSEACLKAHNATPSAPQSSSPKETTTSIKFNPPVSPEATVVAKADTAKDIEAKPTDW